MSLPYIAFCGARLVTRISKKVSLIDVSSRVSRILHQRSYWCLRVTVLDRVILRISAPYLPSKTYYVPMIAVIASCRYLR